MPTRGVRPRSTKGKVANDGGTMMHHVIYTMWYPAPIHQPPMESNPNGSGISQKEPQPFLGEGKVSAHLSPRQGQEIPPGPSAPFSVPSYALKLAPRSSSCRASTAAASGALSSATSSWRVRSVRSVMGDVVRCGFRARCGKPLLRS